MNSSASKRKAVDNISEKPAKTIRGELAKEVPETITTTDLTYLYLKKFVQRTERFSSRASTPK